MKCTLEDIVTIAQVVSGINVTKENRDKYIGFLQRQMGNHGYDLGDKSSLLEQRLKEYRSGNGRVRLMLLALKNAPLAYMLADMLPVFSYLIGETPVENTDSGESTILLSDDSLHLIRVGSSIYDFPSETIYRIHSRRLNQKKVHPNLMSYMEIINDIGEDQEVVRIWGRKLTYNDDVRLADHRNHKWGGDPGTTATAKAGINF